jgi:hypothetical protein
MAKQKVEKLPVTRGALYLDAAMIVVAVVMAGVSLGQSNIPMMMAWGVCCMMAYRAAVGSARDLQRIIRYNQYVDLYDQLGSLETAFAALPKEPVTEEERQIH